MTIKALNYLILIPLICLLLACISGTARAQEKVMSPEELDAIVAEISNSKYGSFSLKSEDDLYEWTTQEFIPLEFEFDSNLKKTTAITLGIAAIVFIYDDKINDQLSHNSSKQLDKLASVGEFLGGAGALAFPAGMYVYAILAKDDKAQETGSAMFRSVLITGAAAEVLKLAFQRERPDGSDNLSMPSGHSAVAFSMATVIANKYGDDNRFIPVVAYSLAGLTAWSRVHDNKHWASDTVIGALLGHFIAKQVLRKPSITDTGILISPVVNADGEFGINVTYSQRPVKNNLFFENCLKDTKVKLDEYNARLACAEAEIRRNWKRN